MCACQVHPPEHRQSVWSFCRTSKLGEVTAPQTQASATSSCCLLKALAEGWLQQTCLMLRAAGGTGTQPLFKSPGCTLQHHG